jgi:leucyl-tRNA synthetase
MKSYDHKNIEKKWQKEWDDAHVFKTSSNPQDKSYILVEFPYPSGDLHVGHWYAFAVTDIFARYMHHIGKNVFFPFGFDSFGLPAENAAIKRGLNPKTWTYSNIETMSKQVKNMGTMLDWDSQVITSDPEYYKWTQWLFLQFYKKGLVKHEDNHVNWCPSCKTILANEQLEGGNCERCGSLVEQKEMKQWNIGITQYADRLIDDLDSLNWPHHIKEAQKNWIGRSHGTFFTFNIKDSEEKIKVFTTRPDTFMGVTYVVVAPEHDLIQELKSSITNWSDVESYIATTKTKTNLERQTNKDKTGVELKGIQAIHPATGNTIPVFISDYVIASYGTGCVMAVPAHDERDFEFATKYNLPILSVVQNKDKNIELPYVESGTLTNSGEFDGLTSEAAKDVITSKYGEKTTTYKLQDWSVSRQRYWGCPIPMVHCKKCGTIPAPEDQLPVTLPEMEKIEMRDDGKSPLAHNQEWVNIQCHQCGGAAERETDTLDTFVDSSWYYVRYIDSKNSNEIASVEKKNAWLPIDFYSGGSEHTTRHLLYARFVYKVMYDLGIVPQSEPFIKRNNRGLILGPDGNKMSKSKGNVINPDEIVEHVGSDVVRSYLAFMGPYGEAGSYPWDPNGVVGIRRFFERVFELKDKISESDSEESSVAINKMLSQIKIDFEQLKFNTALSKIMICVNILEKNNFSKDTFKSLLVVLNIFAPHIGQELWSQIGESGFIYSQAFPEINSVLLADQKIKIAVQVNGKTRAILEIEPNTSKEQILEMTKQHPEVIRWIENKEIIKEIYIPSKMVSLVISK